MQARVIIKITGVVQGVFFREFVKELADKLKIKGVVKNLIDGSVEVIAEGEEDALRALANACRRGPKRAIVEDLKVFYEEPTGEFNSFRISF